MTEIREPSPFARAGSIAAEKASGRGGSLPAFGIEPKAKGALSVLPATDVDGTALVAGGSNGTMIDVSIRVDVV